MKGRPEVREQLPSILERFRNGDRTPVGVEVFDELTAERARSFTQAVASVRAEGLTVGADAEAIVGRWARGELGTAQMRELVRRLYDAP